MVVSVLARPKLTEVHPDAIMEYWPGTVQLRGVFEPRSVSKVVVDRTFLIEPIYAADGSITVSLPIFVPSSYMRLQLLTIFGDYSNSVWLKYAKHLSIGSLSSKVIYANT